MKQKKETWSKSHQEIVNQKWCCGGSGATEQDRWREVWGNGFMWEKRKAETKNGETEGLLSVEGRKKERERKVWEKWLRFHFFVGGEVWHFFMLEGELKETLVGELNVISPKFWGVMGGAGRSLLFLAAWRRRPANFSVLDFSSRHSCRKFWASSASFETWSAICIGLARISLTMLDMFAADPH